MRKLFIFAASLTLTVLGSLAAQAQTAPNVNVRAAAHSDFDRLVFDWPQNVKFDLKRKGSSAALTFDAAADLKFTREVGADLTRARSVTAHNDGAGHVIVTFNVSPTATIKTFTSNTSVVVDISGKAAIASTAPTPQASSETSSGAASSQNPAAQNPAPIAAPTTQTPQPKVAAASSTVSPPSPPAPANVNPSIVPPLLSPPAVKPPAVIPEPPAAPDVTDTSSSAAPQKTDTFKFNLNDTPLAVATLDPHTATRAAIFERAGYGYIIFERKLTIPAATLASGAPLLVDLQPIDLTKNSGYRFPVPPNSDIQATLDNGVWKIFLSKKRMDLPVTTSLIAQPDFALGARFLLPLPDAPEPVHLTDPVVGDTLIVVPLAQSEAFSVDRRMADFTILSAAQGLVIKPISDKIIVRAVSDGIEITAEGGLHLSRAADTGTDQQSSTKARQSAAGKSIFDFATWSGSANEGFIGRRQKLQQTIVDVPEAERNRARLELARFYFANGNGEEALAMLNFLSKQVPDLRAHADFLGLIGASEILAYRTEDGLRDLSSPLVSDQPEIELWQAVGLAEQRDWPSAEEKFAITESILSGYPEPFFSHFFVLAIESALAVDKTHEAADWLNYISTAAHSTEIDPALTYLQGALHAKAGRAAAAEKAWKEVEASNDRLYKVRAELALIDLGVSTGSLTPAQAADRLEALRFGWRGDDLEVDILHRLGQFYIQAKNVKAGLNALSQAVALYPSSPITPKIHAEMETIFRDVFLSDLGQKLSPLDSLTLYQQYRDLMPSGKDGDNIMRNLSERLVAIDLLDQAASLLEELATNRLKGEDKDHVALRLAGIQLLNHKPTEALAATDLTANDQLAPTLANERELLRARALSELHREADATAILKDNTSQGAMMLRADIAMHGQQWPDAAKALMDLVGPPPSSGRTLSSAQSEWLLNAAIAYALADDQPGLDKLAIDYSAAMASTPQNDTFRMLTQPEKTGQLRDLSAAQSQISQVDMFQGFLNNYRNAPDAAPSPAKP